MARKADRNELKAEARVRIFTNDIGGVTADEVVMALDDMADTLATRDETEATQAQVDALSAGGTPLSIASLPPLP